MLTMGSHSNAPCIQKATPEPYNVQLKSEAIGTTVKFFYMVNTDVPAGVGAHPLDTQLLSTYKLDCSWSGSLCGLLLKLN